MINLFYQFSQCHSIAGYKPVYLSGSRHSKHRSFSLQCWWTSYNNFHSSESRSAWLLCPLPLLDVHHLTSLAREYRSGIFLDMKSAFWCLHFLENETIQDQLACHIYNFLNWRWPFYWLLSEFDSWDILKSSITTRYLNVTFWIKNTIFQVTINSDK